MGKKTRVFMGEGLGGWCGEPEFMRDFAWRWGISMYQEGVYSWLKGVGLWPHPTPSASLGPMGRGRT